MKKIKKRPKRPLRFDILTIFPKIFDSYVDESILGRAKRRKLIDVKTFDLRSFSKSKHRSVDDLPYGGGAGMVLMAEPLLRGIQKIKQTSRISPKKTKVVLFSAKGKQFNQRMAYDWAKKYERIIFVSGRYEGIDERVREVSKAEEISIGPYVLTDGDVAAMVLISAIARLVPGAINLKSLEEESHFNLLLKQEAQASGTGFEYPHYTRPEVIRWKGKNYSVPEVLLSGNHKKIEEWRRGHS